MANTSYMVKEKDRLAKLTVLLDQPSCIPVTVTALPQVQSPADAKSEITMF